MSAFNERREQDVQKLRKLQEMSSERLTVVRVSGAPPSEIDLNLRVKTAPSDEYPRRVQELVSLSVSLPARYPFVEPKVSIKTPILHPNIYSSGLVCLGVKWMPSFGLDLLVRRIVQIVIFDPSILNEASPANRQALDWYQKVRAAQPSAFPTDSFEFREPSAPKKMTWSHISTTPQRVQVVCTSCSTKLAVPSGRSGRVRCPKCGFSFEVST